jgi:hypothetical protein
MGDDFDPVKVRLHDLKEVLDGRTSFNPELPESDTSGERGAMDGFDGGRDRKSDERNARQKAADFLNVARRLKSQFDERSAVGEGMRANNFDGERDRETKKGIVAASACYSWPPDPPIVAALSANHGR